MKFIENIKGEFILDHSYNILKSSREPIKIQNQIPLKVKIMEIDLDSGITFRVSDPNLLNGFVQPIIENLSKGIEKDCEFYKKSLGKIIDAWENSSEKFKSVNGSNGAYKYVGLLNDKEYMVSPFVSFINISMFFGQSIGAGYGADTYKNKEYYKEALKIIDSWFSKVLKDMKSSKFEQRVKVQLGKMDMELSFKEVLKFISIPETITKEKTPEEKPPFPFQFPSDILNQILRECEGLIDEEIIQWVNEEINFDISKLQDWEIEVSHEGSHNHDGQVCEYTVTFTSPEGIEYYLYNQHCLVTGWNFDGTLIPE